MRPRLWLLIFILLQLADGVLTYAAVDRFGLQAEGNPILVTWIMIAGAMPALFGAKLLACACGAVIRNKQRRSPNAKDAGSGSR